MIVHGEEGEGCESKYSNDHGKKDFRFHVALSFCLLAVRRLGAGSRGGVKAESHILVLDEVCEWAGRAEAM